MEKATEDQREGRAVPNVVIAAGGTAGHVVPALAIADELRDSGVTVSFLGARGRLEADLVPKAGYEVDLLDLSGIDRKNPLKAARAGVITGVLLAVARIAGETAPLLFTALSNQFWTSDLGEPMASLPVTIFKFAMSPYENWQKLAWTGVFLITAGVLLLNILARVLFKKTH